MRSEKQNILNKSMVVKDEYNYSISQVLLQTINLSSAELESM